MTGTKDMLTPPRQAPSPLARRLVWANAVLWALLVPVTLAFAGAGEALPDVSEPAKIAMALLAPAVGVLVNLAGAVALAVAVQRLGQRRAWLIACGAGLQVVAVFATAAVISIAVGLDHARLADSDATSRAIIAGFAASGLAYLAGQIAIGRSVTVLSRRVSAWYTAAPLLVGPYVGLTVGFAVAEEWTESLGPAVFVPVTVLAGTFFIVMPVLWFRLAVLLSRAATAPA